MCLTCLTCLIKFGILILLFFILRMCVFSQIMHPRVYNPLTPSMRVENENVYLKAVRAHSQFSFSQHLSGRKRENQRGE
jgi:hypothetical protein